MHASSLCLTLFFYESEQMSIAEISFLGFVKT